MKQIKLNVIICESSGKHSLFNENLPGQVKMSNAGEVNLNRLVETVFRTQLVYIYVVKVK